MREYEIDQQALKMESKNLRAGDRIRLNGEVYTARDAAHKRMIEQLEQGERIPFALKGAIIYYAGPSPAKAGMAIGSCGPTTSSRMDRYTPRLLYLGISGIIGKGEVGEEVQKALIETETLYLCAVGGAGALIARHIKEAEEIAYRELGCESVKRLKVEGMPLTVGLDLYGGNIFKR